MIDKAIAKITQEAMAIGDELSIFMEEYLTNKCTNESVAQKILADDKKLKDVHTAVWDKAKKKKKGNCAHIPDAEILEDLDKYYGLDETSVPAGKIDIMDLL